MPPPAPLDEFPEMVELVIVSSPFEATPMPPPLLVVVVVVAFPVMITLLSVTFSLAIYRPPPSPLPNVPPVIVIPDMVMASTPAPLMLNTRDWPWPLIVSRLAPGPVIVTGCVMLNCPCCIRIDFDVVKEASKTMVSASLAALACWIARRNVPAGKLPLPSAGPSSVFDTVNVAGAMRSSSDFNNRRAFMSDARRTLRLLRGAATERENSRRSRRLTGISSNGAEREGTTGYERMT